MYYCGLVLLGLMTAGMASLGAEAKKMEDLECYVCTSAVDKDCEEFDEDVFKDKFIESCDEPPSSDGQWDEGPVGCRKILQEIEGKYRTVRQCAWSGENVEGLKRTGNEGVRLWYYQCDENNLCNGATSLKTMSPFKSIFALLLPLSATLLLLLNH